MSSFEFLRNCLTLLREALIPSGTLTERTVKSGIWASATNVLGRSLSILSLIILARLLDPKAFGLMGIALLSLTGLKQFSNPGLNSALVQHADDDVDEYLNATWSVNVIRGVVIAGVLVASAPTVASFFDEPRATALLQTIALSPLLLGLRNPGVVYFQKHLEFHKSFAFEMSGSLIRFVVSVGYALVNPSVWALVFGYLASDAVRLIASYLLHNYRPRPVLDPGRVRELFGYGKWLMGTEILYYLYSQGDDVVVGWLLAASALGFYQVAYRLSSAPATEITHVVSSVLFPTFSKIHDETDRLREAFFRTLRIVTLTAVPMAVGIFTVAPTFVSGIMGEQWMPMVPIIQILAVFGLVRAFGSTFGTVFKAVGKPDYTTKLLLLNVVTLAILIYPATRTYGIEGAALAALIAHLVKVIAGAHLLTSVIETTHLRLFGSLGYPLVASGTMGGVILLVRGGLPPGSMAAEFVVVVALGVLTYLVAILALDRLFSWGITDEITTVVRSLTG